MEDDSATFRTAVDALCRAGNVQRNPFPQPQPAAPDEKGAVFRIALKDQLRNLTVPRFEGNYDLQTVVTFFESVELVFQAIRLDPSRPATEADSFNAIRVAQGYFDHDA
jgi:hypothetical protein